MRVIEAVRAELEIDVLLDPGSIKRDGWLKRLWRIIRLTSILHPMRGIREIRKYLKGQRDMHLNLFMKTIEDVKKANLIFEEIWPTVRDSSPK